MTLESATINNRFTASSVALRAAAPPVVQLLVLIFSPTPVSARLYQDASMALVDSIGAADIRIIT